MNAKPARLLSTYRTVLVAGLLAVASPAWPAALTWVGTGADSDFNTPANWSPAQTPGSSDTCTITSTSSRQPSVLTNASCGSLTMGTAASVMTLTLTTKNLSVAGDVTIGANGRVTPSGVSIGIWTIGGNWNDDLSTTNFTSANIHNQFTFNGSPKTISSNENFYHIQIDGSIALASNLVIVQTLAISPTYSLTQGPYTLTHSGTLFSIAGTYSHTCASTLIVNGAFNMENFIHYPNVTINSGATLFGGNDSWIDCDLTIQAGGTFNINTPIYVSGDWVNNGGTLICSTGTITMNGSGKRIRGTAAGTWFHHLTIGDGGADSVTAESHVDVVANLTVAAGATFTLQAGKNIALTGSNASIAGTMNLSGTSTWTQVGGNNVGINVAVGGLLSALGIDSANRVTFTRSGGNYYELVINGGINFNQVNLDYTQSATASAGLAINSPSGAVVNFNNVSFRNTENINNAVMMVWNSNKTVTAGGVTFDSATYSPGDPDVNVEARQGTITFAGYGGNYAGEALDNDNGGTATWTLLSLSGRVFEDGNFAGTAIDWDGGVADLGLANVDVELYTTADVYQTSATTAAGGTFSFTNLSSGTYKVRARSATIGDADTPPQGTFRPCVPASCAYPLPEMTWANGAALYGGQSVTIDDTAIGNNAGTGDTYVSVAIASASVTNVNLGFAYNLIVNADDDAVVVTSRSKQGSLREFIKNANAIGTSGGTTANSSRFRIGSGCDGAGVCTINATGAFPPLADTGGGTTIDGYTQSGASANTVAAPGASNAALKIQISGGGASSAGFTLSSANNFVKGLAIGGFSGVGVGSGITVTGAVATGNTVSGNYVGTNAAGTASAGNYFGVYIVSGAQSNTVGGTTPAERNLLSGNTSGGIEIVGATTSGNLVKGNYIGTAVNGVGALGNTFDGVGLYAPSNTIGGATVAERNIISGNGGDGVVMGGGSATSNLIKGNFIGVDVNGAARPNGQSGIRINVGANSNIVGGTAEGEGNMIASNGVNGLRVASTGNQIFGNTIRANTQAGVNSLADGQTIAMNLIRNNGGVTYDGVALAPGATNNKLYHNTIHANGGSGVSINDTGAILRNNIITGNAAYGINRVAASMTESSNDVTDNVINPASVRNAAGRSNPAGILDATDLNADPLYVNVGAGDLTLTECTSPAIDKGVALGVDQPDMNGAGAGLFNGVSPDMGAFETSCAAALTLVKQIWLSGGASPIAVTNGAPTSVVVPAGSTLVFLIYTKNASGAALPDVRFRDLLDVSASGFDYVPNSLVRTLAASPPADTASDLAIFTATDPGTGTAQTDAVDGDVTSVCESGAASCPGVILNRVTVGNTTGLSPAQVNATLSIPANSIFAIRFHAVKK